MKILSFLFVLFGAFSVSAQTTNITERYVKILRTGYSIDYPTSWTLDTSKSFGLDVLFRSPKTDSLDDFYENLNVFVQDLRGQNYDLKRMGQESEAQIRSMISDVEIIEGRLDISGPQHHYMLKYRGRQGKFLLTTIQHYYLKGDIGYALTFTIKRGREVEYLAICERMFASFKF